MALATAPSRIDPEVIADQLLEARARTLLLAAPLTDDDLHLQHDPLMSPILWDLGHIAHFEELWLTRNLDGPIEFVEMPGLYNPFEHPRSARGKLALPGLEEVRDVMDEIRGRVLARLVSADLDGAAGESHHAPPEGRHGRSLGHLDPRQRPVGRALLELQRLQDRLVVLVLVLQLHVVDEPVTQERCGGIEIG